MLGKEKSERCFLLAGIRQFVARPRMLDRQTDKRQASDGSDGVEL
jgi:hypothetical protein